MAVFNTVTFGIVCEAVYVMVIIGIGLLLAFAVHSIR